MYSPKVAVVDSGVDTQNQEIMQHVIQGFSFQKSAEDNGIVESDHYAFCKQWRCYHKVESGIHRFTGCRCCGHEYVNSD